MPTDRQDTAGLHAKWLVAGLLFLGTLVNYFDRLAMPTVAPALRQDYGFTNVQFSLIFNAFLLFYALSMWVWGGVFDRIGNRAGFSVAVLIWSLAEASTGLARNLGGFCVARAFLGAGEAGNWPGATRTIAAWFPARQRALAMGLANAGASLGPALGIPLILGLKSALGWRAVFFTTGGVGLVWLALWLALYPPNNAAVPAARPAPVPLRALLKTREARGIILARFLGDPVWWLYLNWMPLYLAEARGYDLAHLKASGWVPYVAAALGAVSGGWFSGALIARTGNVNGSRKLAIVAGTLAMLAGAATGFAASAPSALALMSVTLFGFQFWVANVQTLASDFFPVEAVGSVAGVAGSAAAMGAMLFTAATGVVVDHFSYTPVLIAGALLAPLATLCLFTLCGTIRPLTLSSHDAH